jgi:hypothetical protein
MHFHFVLGSSTYETSHPKASFPTQKFSALSLQSPPCRRPDPRETRSLTWVPGTLNVNRSNLAVEASRKTELAVEVRPSWEVSNAQSKCPDLRYAICRCHISRIRRVLRLGVTYHCRTHQSPLLPAVSYIPIIGSSGRLRADRRLFELL